MKTTVAHWNDRGDDYVYIGRDIGDGYFGNPFRVGIDGTRVEVLSKYEVYFLRRLCSDKTFRIRVRGLRGKQLVCHCKPNICHGDVIAEFLNDTFGG